MKDFTVVANSGIQMFTVPMKVSLQEKFSLWFHEWQSTDDTWVLDLVYEHKEEDTSLYYKKKDLYDRGFFAESQEDFTEFDLREKGVAPICREDMMSDGTKGEIYKLTFSDKNNTLASFENVWLPLPYFFKKTEKRFQFGPLNWARFKLIPRKSCESGKMYDVLVALDTHTKYEPDPHNEWPVFPDQFRKEMPFMVCSNEYQLLDMCAQDREYSYIGEYLFKLVHPELQNISQLKNSSKKLNYIASYVFLIQYIAKFNLLPKVVLYKEKDVETKSVDLVVDIGNSRTTALLIEDGFEDFTKVPRLQLIDYTNPLVKTGDDETKIRSYEDSFDMRLAFRRVSFGDFGPMNSRQFVYPSLVRLGNEANYLIHHAIQSDTSETMSTCSSPKRYLWDGKPNREEWQFLLMPGESQDGHILQLKGVTNQLTNTGEIDKSGNGGKTYHYSRRSLMTFAFLEMLIQARAQVNSDLYRENKGKKDIPRQIKRLIVTCPTAMSKLEREKLIACAKNAVIMMENFGYDDITMNKKPGSTIEIAPAVLKKSEDQKWYYDEATCSQLVYMFGEIGHKYKGSCEEFFSLFGKKMPGEQQSSLIVGSLDIGAGTSDLMISRYTYKKDSLTTLLPDPLFYDSYYYAGDDMLKGLIIDLMMRDEQSAFFTKQKDMSYEVCRQKLRDVFGPDYNGQTEEERVFRRNFNLQYSIPLMYHFLDLITQKSENCIVHYQDVFESLPPHESVLTHFKKVFGFGLDTLEWQFDYEKVNKKITDHFEPYMKKIATIMFAKSCDLVILSGRPASLPSIRNLFLKYYAVSPDRLILLNNYYVGRWFPYGKNTGYVVDAKTIVAVGAIIGHYSSKLSSLNNFAIDTTKLDGKLKSTVNYVEQFRESNKVSYCITPEKPAGEVYVNKLPAHLNVRQLGIDVYPSRSLYAIDFNREKIKNKLIAKCISDSQSIPTDSRLVKMVNDEIEMLRNRAPFKITLEKDLEDNETLTISSIEDRNGNDLSGSSIEVHIQSLGVEDKYWLDDGAFDF